LLHPLVDEVYAFGIGRGSNVNELKEIASDPDNWAVMDTFAEYKEFVRLFMLVQQGCYTSTMQPYRIIDLRTPNYISYGVSDATVNSWNSEHPTLACGGKCVGYPEYDRDIKCAECSEKIAEADLEAMKVFKQNITEAANAKCFNAALLAGFISRQTQGGKLLEGTNGWIPCTNSANGQCYGIMHMNNISTSKKHLHMFIL